MKSSTIRRSNLSKEKMQVLEALSKYRHESYDNAPGVYVRPETPQDKEQQLDMLWQNFRINQKPENSPNVYLATGFIAGLVVMLILSILISFSAKGISNMKENAVAPVKKEKFNLNFIPATDETNSTVDANEMYIVQSGDTMESIIIRFFGSYSKEKETAILKANKMTNPNKLSIGQKLTIPLE